MTISLNGTTGITTPAETVNGDETVTGNLNVTGNVTVTGLINANGGGTIKSGTLISTATTTFTGATTGSSINLTAISPTGTIQIGQVIAGTNIAAGTTIIAQQSGTTGGAGVYTLSQASTGTVSGAITVVGVDFTGIPSNTKRVTILLNQVSTAGSGVNLLVQLGTTLGIESSGYVGAVNREVNQLTFSTGFALTFNNNITYANTSQIILSAIGGNIWVVSFITAQNVTGTAIVSYGAGVKPLTTGVLDRVRITTVNGTDTFDLGSINILYE